MYTQDGIYLGLAQDKKIILPLSMANRHGLIAGATGTGKTITMKVMAESFSDAGVPVFLCDVKGDVSGLNSPGVSSEGMEKRIDRFGIRDTFSYCSYPVTFWDIYQQKGHPLRAAVSDMGPELLSRILGLTAAQEGVLHIIFQIADDNGLYLDDLKDLKALLSYVGDHKADYITTYGNIAAQSLGGIVRSLLPLERQGGDLFFGKPELDIRDWMRTAPDGRGMINLLDCTELIQNPSLYAVFLLWMMSELFENLPEAGDTAKPKLVFFFDEAHLLFDGAPKVLVQKIQQMVKLIRSKGVGIYFVTQSPSDIPDTVLAQLGHRVQHALHAYTPAEQKAVKAAAQSLRPNPAFNAADVITELGIGKALVSLLNEEGVPGIVEHTAIICPQSLMAPTSDAERAEAMRRDGMPYYDELDDRESAYEKLNLQRELDETRLNLEKEKARLAKEQATSEARKIKEEAAARKKWEKEMEALRKKEEREEAARAKEEARRRARIEKEIVNTGAYLLQRGLMNTLLGGGRRRR